MQATLIYNSNAGDDEPSSDDLLAGLRGAGYRVHKPTEEDLDRVLKDPSGLVVAAGGDGTVGAVATRLSGRGVPMAVLPLGTANNIGKTLGLEGPLEHLMAGLAAPRRRPFDIGLARGPWGETPFVEAVGAGLFAHTLASRASEEDKEPQKALQLLKETLSNYQAQDCEVTLDGEDLSGRYLLVEAMNIRSLGPNLELAPEADPGDGLLEVVLVSEGEREALAGYLKRRLAGEESPSGLAVRRGRHLQFRWRGPVHIDDDAWPEGDDETAKDGVVAVDISLQAQALELWLPGERAGS
ncbi:MAG: diacylglycerol kinase family lipid kinase [Deinococcota bacterium]|jgi:diacylglycerol kinase family enzyme|nr:diacylglycerol kinase family lipid kinase [Deinococcota bacterium]